MLAQGLLAPGILPTNTCPQLLFVKNLNTFRRRPEGRWKKFQSMTANGYTYAQKITRKETAICNTIKSTQDLHRACIFAGNDKTIFQVSWLQASAIHHYIGSIARKANPGLDMGREMESTIAEDFEELISYLSNPQRSRQQAAVSDNVPERSE
jgi:hypothetical protein